MTRKFIISRFNRYGFDIHRDNQSGMVHVKTSRGLYAIFNSYASAYCFFRSYFNKKLYEVSK